MSRLDYIPNPLPYFTTNSFASVPRINPLLTRSYTGGIPPINAPIGAQPPISPQEEREAPPINAPIGAQPPISPQEETEAPPVETEVPLETEVPPTIEPPTITEPPPSIAPELPPPPEFHLGAPTPTRPPPTYASVPGATTPSYQQPGYVPSYAQAGFKPPTAPYQPPIPAINQSTPSLTYTQLLEKQKEYLKEEAGKQKPGNKSRGTEQGGLPKELIQAELAGLAAVEGISPKGVYDVSGQLIDQAVNPNTSTTEKPKKKKPRNKAEANEQGVIPKQFVSTGIGELVGQLGGELGTEIYNLTKHGYAAATQETKPKKKKPRNKAQANEQGAIPLELVKSGARGIAKLF